MLTEPRYYRFESALGALYLTISEGLLSSLQYEASDHGRFVDPLPAGDIRGWLEAYFNAQRPPPLRDFHLDGTTFQKKVWAALLQIPYAQTISYGQLAKVTGSAPRAVGQACKRNPLPVIVPCHRVVASHSIGGYQGASSGAKLDRKQWLLNHEKIK